jgi:hypothetical protein
LTTEERASLPALLRKGVAPARKLTHARILPRADEGGSVAPSCRRGRHLDISSRIVERARRCFVEGGLSRVLHDKPRLSWRPKQGQALIAVCSDNRKYGRDCGRPGWTRAGECVLTIRAANRTGQLQ